MWSRWWCAGGGIGSLKQRTATVVTMSHGYGGKLRFLNPPLLGLRQIEIAEECGVRRRDMAPLSFEVKRVRGMCSSPPADSSNWTSCDKGSGSGREDSMSFAEAKKLMKLVNVESLKRKLCREEKEVIPLSELLKVCESMGVARTPEEASAYARVLDEAGVILLFRDKVYLHPQKVSYYTV